MEQQTISDTKLDFSNTRKAYSYKPTPALRKALWMFQILNHPILGAIGKSLLKFAVKFNLPVKSIIKATLYQHFVGGEDLDDCLPMVENLHSGNVYSILDYSDEGKESPEEIESAFLELLHNIRFASEHSSIPFSVFKPTAIASTALLEKVSNQEVLTTEEKEEWTGIHDRFETLCKTAHDLRTPLMIDAEESWIQKAIDDLALEMMRKYNREEVYVINTYQLYRKDRLGFLKQNLQYASENGFKIGAKLVRGAYMEKERDRAEEKNLPSPIQNTKADTDRDYDAAVRFCMQHLDRIFLVVATHNEQSSKIGAQLLNESSYPRDYRNVWFSQLLGMCDHISFNLASEGYNVAKYIPYGPVKAVAPYLVRRADENSSVSGQAAKEMALIKKELQRRRKEKKSA